MSAKLFSGRYMAIAIPAIILQLAVFKFFYPFASYFFTDSFSYLYTAASNQDVGTWPIGYSKFLRVLNTFIHSDTGLVCCQYFFLHGCGLYFLSTVFDLFRPGRVISVVLFIMMIFNPLFLWLANSVSSDALFIGLSLLWVAVLMRMIERPSRSLLFIHAGLLPVIFMIRYNAIYYPLTAALAILLSSYPVRQKILAILLPLLLIGGFITYTIRSTEALTGTRTFSPFGGWQLANNVLYAYGKSYEKMRKGASQGGAVPVQYAALDRQVRRYFDTAKTERTLFDNTYPGIYFLWSPQSPLVQYAAGRRGKDSAVSWYSAWTAVGPVFSGYAAWLMKKYPAAYARDFLWPNVVRYAMPPLEFMAAYNSGMDTVQQVAQYWFRYKDNRVKAVSMNFQALLLGPYSFLCLVINLSFLLLTLLLLTTREARIASPALSRCLPVVGSCWLLHLVFSVVAAPVVLRYQLFLMIICGSFNILIVTHLLSWDKKNRESKKIMYEKENHDCGRLRLLPGLFIRLCRHREALPAGSIHLPAERVSMDPASVGNAGMGGTQP